MYVYEVRSMSRCMDHCTERLRDWTLITTGAWGVLNCRGTEGEGRERGKGRGERGEGRGGREGEEVKSSAQHWC